ncbi:MAG: hypothetical protein L0215_11415 [Gemmataceae bacterium]|nr:hypothetical protein [Gemmataceae bacterium]
MAKKRARAKSLDLGEALGATEGYSDQCFSIYIPNKDRTGREIGNQRNWVLEGIRLLTQINKGATAMPPVEGAWQNDKGTLIWENPVVVYSFIKTAPFVENLGRIREFLHRLGRETNQEEVAFEFDGRFYLIKDFE